MGNNGPVSLIPVPGNIMEKMMRGVTEKALKFEYCHWSQPTQTHEWKVLFNLMSFNDKFTHVVDPVKPVDVILEDFSRAFDTVPQRILLDRMSCIGLDRNTVLWVSIWPMDGAQRLTVKVFHQAGGWSQARFPRTPFEDHFSLKFSSMTCMQD